MKKLISLTIIMAAIVVACRPEKEINLNKHSFQEDLKTHIEAIQNRNFDDLEPTVAADVSMIGPDGTKMESKEVFMEFHKNWFKLKNWEWKGNILKAESSDSLAYALVQYRYTENDSLGKSIYESDAYLLLVFRNSQVGWQLVHDQNTRIPKTQN